MADEVVQDVEMETQIPDVNLWSKTEDEKKAEEPEVEATPAGDAAAVAAVVEEKKPEEPKKEPEIPPALQKLVDDLTRRDADMREKEVMYREGQKASQELEKLRERLKKSPMDALREVGADPTQLMSEILGPDPEETKIAQSPTVKRLLAEITELKTRHEQTAAERTQERQREAQQRVYQEYSDFAKSADKYPMLKSFADSYGPQRMFALAAEYAAKTNQLPNVEDLARHTEEMLVKEAQGVLERLQGIETFKERFSGKLPTDNGKAEEAATRVESKPKQKGTLTNADTAEPPPTSKPKPLINASAREIIAAGLKAAPKLWKEE